MINKYCRHKSILYVMIAIIGLISFWIFSRYTVDDAFITWRYGFNLIKFGHWNYNPSGFDETQSYTNPIFAALSIIPAVLGFNVVFFFKIISLLITVIAVLSFSKKQNFSGVVVAVLILVNPFSIIHSFAGLETFLFASLLAGSLISAYNNNKNWSYAFALVLFFTRPESWLLALLLPLYFNHGKWMKSVKEDPAKARSYFSSSLFVEFFALSSVIAAFLLFNFTYFGLALPNSFYIKVGKNISLLSLSLFTVCLLPVSIMPKNNKAFVVLCLALFGAMAVNYSKSDLMMDYAGRFAYHIVTPLALVLNSLINRKNNVYQCNNGTCTNALISNDFILKTFPIIFFGIFSIINAKSVIGTILYYPKLLNAHAELGMALKNDLPHNAVISIADAGIVPYNSELNNLDYIGLGSKLVAKYGLTTAILEKYNPSVIMLYRDKSGSLVEGHNQRFMAKWLINRHILYLCTVQWSKRSSLAVYSNMAMPSVEKICASSRVENAAIDSKGLLESLLTPPWYYWRTH